MCRKPIIGLTTNYEGIDATLRDRYYKSVVAAGGVPVLLPPLADVSVVERTLDMVDGVVLTGGGDCDPRLFGEAPQCELTINAERDVPELLLVRRARERNIPMLGICRGMQMMAVALGGHVQQDIARPEHSQRAPEDWQGADYRSVATHEVSLSGGVRRMYGVERLAVNSYHHQAVDRVPQGFEVVATADDVIEGMMSVEGRAELGVQWHPEWLADGDRLFAWLVAEARLLASARSLHSRIITLDSHCDTPMFFASGADFTRRDDRVKVDVAKMADGLLDVATMVAYVPQGIAEPFAYAEGIYDRIAAQTTVVRTREEIMQNKSLGRRSIMLGLENASAVEDDLSRVRYLKDRGVVYFTLCHNGDNQVCDSARRSQGTWGGLSPFGRELVREMNRVGVLVDLSHAAESTFYDALELSAVPVVCSHSNCRALCDHERNLRDEQLMALARKGGVCQLTLYGGFVSVGEADIYRFMEHVDHAVRLMGVEHVGFGSDFDGDGGIAGLQDASDALQFTLQLLRRRYNEEDIKRLWSENWLRLLP